MVKKLKHEKKKGPNKLLILVLIFLLSFFATFGTEMISYKAQKDASVYNGLETQKMPYTEFIKELDNKNVEQATLSESSPTVIFYLKGNDMPYETTNPGTEDFKETLLLSGVSVDDKTYGAEQKSTSSTYMLITSALSSLFISVITSLIAMMAITMVSSMNVFERKSVEKAKTVSFADIVGLDEIKNELLFIVSLMKNKKASGKARIPKGILLEGPSGNGKTMLAQAIATEADVNFMAVNASDFSDKFMGETGKSVRKAFDKAKQNAPCVLFIDEIDAIGAKRAEDAEKAIDKEWNGVINSLLTKMDGITDSAGVTVIAATNMASSLDPALVRPGRFDKHFYIPHPDASARKDLLSTYLQDGTKEKYNYDKLAAKTRGCSCAEIESIVNEAKLIAYKEDKETPDEACILQAIRHFRLKGFSKGNIDLSQKEKETVSLHEAGHAVVAHFFANKKVGEISICPTTSGVGGYTEMDAKDNDNLRYSEEVFGEIVILLGGKAAESVISGGDEKISLGSDNDLSTATKLAMDCVKFKSGIDYCRFGDAGMGALMKESKAVLDAAYEKAIETVNTYKEKTVLTANTLIEKEILSGEDFLALIA